MSALIRLSPNDEPQIVCGLGSFLEENYLEPEERTAIESLTPGQAYRLDCGVGSFCDIELLGENSVPPQGMAWCHGCQQFAPLDQITGKQCADCDLVDSNVAVAG